MDVLRYRATRSQWFTIASSSAASGGYKRQVPCHYIMLVKHGDRVVDDDTIHRTKRLSVQISMDGGDSMIVQFARHLGVASK